MDSMETVTLEDFFSLIPILCGAKAHFGLDHHNVEVSRPHTIRHIAGRTPLDE